MFAFGFSKTDDVGPDRSPRGVIANVLNWAPAEEVKFEADVLDVSIKSSSVSSITDANICYINPTSALQELTLDSDVLNAEQQHTDLVPSKYEGGLKVWECTFDLVRYLENEIKYAKIDFDGKDVLDLGCGHGILGIFALQKGARVHFQDYNKSVLSSVTIQNIMLNFPHKEWKNKLNLCRFFSGDWESFLQLVKEEGQKYDIILSSETIYNPQNQQKLCSVFKKTLNSNGTVYLAGKTYYFGVGGSLRQFESMLCSAGDLASETCWKSSDGVQREILKITFKKDR
ncbi:histidine protein methyltransferase 1 homolog [Schistocerca nitens]|uniref:histidine protein methyltransferase 1 homolog n=1 Tax=Schistocerca nitens TaxID=7011 RepID=UPI0021180B83|nr:histidine protein methyltransferase 1 homolog [Schistocerca nitens]